MSCSCRAHQRGPACLKKPGQERSHFLEAHPLQVDGIGPHVMYWLKCTWHLAMYVTPWGKLTKQNKSPVNAELDRPSSSLTSTSANSPEGNFSPVHLCLGGMIKTKFSNIKKHVQVQRADNKKDDGSWKIGKNPTPATWWPLTSGGIVGSGLPPPQTGFVKLGFFGWMINIIYIYMLYIDR